MKKDFRNWLYETQNLPLYAKSGSRSTAYDYAFRISHVCKNEKMGWDTLAKNIAKILPLYTYGEKSDFGKKSHESVRRALVYFSKFLSERVSGTSRAPSEVKKSRSGLRFFGL